MNMLRNRKLTGSLIIGGILFCGGVSAEIQLKEPAGGSTVVLLPENQKKIIKFKTHEERLAELNKDRKEKKTTSA